MSEKKEVVCQICGKTFKSLFALGIHLRKTEKCDVYEYYTKYIIPQKQCPICGKDVPFRGIVKGFPDYCSIACLNKSDYHKEKVKEGVMKKYGVSCVLSDNNIKEKIKNTMIEKYGVDHNSKTQSYKDSYKKTSLLRYGETHPSKSKQIKEKSRHTSLEKYGVEHPWKSNMVLEKRKKTFIEKYGVDNPSKNSNVVNKILNTNKKRFFERLYHSDRLRSFYVPMFTLEEYDGVCGAKHYNWKCLKCNTVFNDYLDDGHVPRCPTCYPKQYNYSSIENSVEEYLKSIDIEYIKADRCILDGKELDFVIPKYNIAIEIDGLYWHSENGPNRVTSMYHLEKTEKCLSKNIFLMHIFEDEWVNKYDIVKSMIKSKTKKIDNKIYARKCLIKNVECDTASEFLTENHIQGYIRNGVHYGLFYNEELVAILTMGKPRFNNNYEWEILRFCNKLNTTVVGGFSKLLKCFKNTKTPESIISYVDRRYGIGNFYTNFGFEWLHDSKPSYFYIKRNKRMNRFNYQKHMLSEKLELFDPSLTEWENMKLNGYDRIWDCGNRVYVWKSK